MISRVVARLDSLRKKTTANRNTNVLRMIVLPQTRLAQVENAFVQRIKFLTLPGSAETSFPAMMKRRKNAGTNPISNIRVSRSNLLVTAIVRAMDCYAKMKSATSELINVKIRSSAKCKDSTSAGKTYPQLSLLPLERPLRE